MLSLQEERAERAWEETHAKALLFASSLVNIKYDVSVPKAVNQTIEPKSSNNVAENHFFEMSSMQNSSSDISTSKNDIVVMSLADFYANENGEFTSKSARLGSPNTSASRPYSRHDLRVQTPKAADYMDIPSDLGELSQRSMESVESVESMTSLLTTSSLGSLGSSSSILPFPFHLPPKIPHVDTFVPQYLKYSQIKKGQKAHRSGIDVSKRGRETCERGDRTRDDASTVCDQRDSASISGSVMNVDTYDASSVASVQTGAPASSSEVFTKEQIDQVMQYFNSFATSSRQGSAAYEITLAEFDAVFRRHSRAMATVEDEKLARELLVSLEWLLQKCDLSPDQWFVETDTRDHHSSGDNKLTLLELECGIDKLCDRIGMPHWRRKDIRFLLRQIDPNGDGNLTLLEIKMALNQLHKPLRSLLVMREAGPIIWRINNYLRKHAIKVRDVFARVDTDKSDSISAQELRTALHTIFKLPASTDSTEFCLNPSRNKRSSPLMRAMEAPLLAKGQVMQKHAFLTKLKGLTKAQLELQQKRLAGAFVSPGILIASENTRKTRRLGVLSTGGRGLLPGLDTTIQKNPVVLPVQMKNDIDRYDRLVRKQISLLFPSSENFKK